MHKTIWVSTLRIVVLPVCSFARSALKVVLTKIAAAKIPMIASTIKISIKVKPCPEDRRDFCIFFTVQISNIIFGNQPPLKNIFCKQICLTAAALFKKIPNFKLKF
jgi:hypothetical protein